MANYGPYVPELNATNGWWMLWRRGEIQGTPCVQGIKGANRQYRRFGSETAAQKAADKLNAGNA